MKSELIMGLEKPFVDEFCKKLEKIGWREEKPLEIENSLNLELFKEKIKEINKEIFKQYDEEKIFKSLLTYLQNANEVKILEFLRYGITISIKKWNSNIPITLKLIDYDNINNNAFNFVREQRFLYSNTLIRPDITLFVNGIPLVILEGKDPLKPTLEYQYIAALEQIMRYQKENRDLFRFVQLGVAVAESNPYIPTYPKDKIEKIPEYSFWKENRKENIFYLLNPKVLLEYIRYFIVFTKDKKGNRIKICARYMQYYSTKKVLNRISNYLEGKTNKNQGLIWHWQGSGKTYTMYFIANLFLNKYHKKNGLVFFVIDRVDLQKQLEGVLTEIENKRLGDVNKIRNINELNHKLKNADKSWGLNIVLMQKFQPSKINTKIKVNKKEILFLIDEAHRTQYGSLAATMRKIIPKGIFIGFTGTPVFKKEKNTFKYFAYPLKELYLDVYFINQSQEDEFTLPISFRVIEEKDVKILLSEEEIKTLIKSYEKNEELTDSIITGELAKEITSKTSRKINKTTVFLTNEKRIEKVVKYIKEKISEDTEEGTFKAMIVAANRKGCVLYKEKMDKYFPKSFSEVVMSYTHNETDDKIHSFKQSLIKKYKTTDWKKINEKITENFLKKENPKVLIVTDMLLTGFDAPQLKVMYLDKPMFYHRLLQAIARVNRPNKKLGKRKGLIVDSVGLLNHLQKQVNIYHYLAEGNDKKIRNDLKQAFTDNKKDLKILKKNIDTVKNKFKKDYNISLDDWIKKIRDNDLSFLSQLEGNIGYLALRYETDEEVHRLMVLIKEILKIYKSLGAEPDKIDYIWDIKVLSVIYYRFQKKIKKTSKKFIKKEVWDNIIDWINKSTLIDNIQNKFEKEIKISSLPANLRKYYEISDYFYYLKNSSLQYKANPLYKEIYKRLEKLRSDWMARNIDSEEFLKKLKEIEKTKNKYDKIEKKSPWKKISEFVKVYLNKETGKKIQITEVETKLKEIVNKKRFLDTDKKELRIIIAKTLLRYKLDKKKRDELEKYTMDLITKEVEKELWRKK